MIKILKFLNGFLILSSLSGGILLASDQDYVDNVTPRLIMLGGHDEDPFENLMTTEEVEAAMTQAAIDQAKQAEQGANLAGAAAYGLPPFLAATPANASIIFQQAVNQLDIPLDLDSLEFKIFFEDQIKNRFHPDSDQKMNYYIDRFFEAKANDSSTINLEKLSKRQIVELLNGLSAPSAAPSDFGLGSSYVAPVAIDLSDIDLSSKLRDVNLRSLEVELFSVGGFGYDYFINTNFSNKFIELFSPKSLEILERLLLESGENYQYLISHDYKTKLTNYLEKAAQRFNENFDYDSSRDGYQTINSDDETDNIDWSDLQ